MLASAPVCGGAAAQSVESATPTIGSMFARDRTQTVQDRQIPGYTREGVRIGAFNVRPEVATSIFLTDNLYATRDDRVSNAAVLIAPSVTARLSNTATTVSIGAGGQVARYFSRSSENTTIYNIDGQARHEIGGGFWVSGIAGYRHQNERRSDPGAINVSIRPIQFDAFDARGELGWEGGRFRLAGGAGGGLFRFEDGRLADGTVLSQAYRDRNLERANVTADYALTAALALRVQGAYVRSDYRLRDTSTIDRSSNRYEVLGGATFEFTDLLRGEIGLGYITQTYDSAAFRPFDGFGGRVRIDYLPSRITTISLTAERTIEEAGLPQSPFYLRNGVNVSVDHELYRNVILSGYVGYDSNRFRNPDRSDRRPAFGVSGTYRFNKTLQAFARYDFLDVTSNPEDRGRRLRLNSGSIGLSFGI